YLAAVERRREELRAALARRGEELKRDREGRADAVRWAALGLSRFEDLPRAYLRHGTVVALLVLFVVGVLLLTVGVLRTVGGTRSPRGAFTAAMVALGAGAGVYLGTGELRRADGGGRDRQGEVARADWTAPERMSRDRDDAGQGKQAALPAEVRVERTDGG